MSLQFLDVYLAQYSILLPLIFGLLRYKYLSRPYRWIFLFVLMGLILEILTEVSVYFGNNFYLFHLDTLAQGLTLIPFFYFSFPSSNFRKVLKLAFILLFLVEIFEITFITGIYHYNSISRSYLSVLMSVLSFQYLRSLGKNQVLVDIHRHPMFWFCLAILLYFFANFLIFFFGYQLGQTSMLDFLLAHRIHLITLIMSRLMLTIGFWRVPKTRHLWS
jgi:hypothetical protein